MNKIIKIILLGVFFLASGSLALAADVNLTIRDRANIVFSGTVSLPTSITSLNDIDTTPHAVDPSSVLATVGSADETSGNFNISNLTYFSSFNSLYLKCITYSSGEKCDDWQYVVNGSYPQTGMDQNILAGGENIYVYFGPQNRVQLSSNNINQNGTLVVTAQKYDYENNAWITRTGVTIGLTQSDPLNPFLPTEIQTLAVDDNGQASFSSIPAGSYDVGVREDFYFPNQKLTVVAPSMNVSGAGSGNSSSGSNSQEQANKSEPSPIAETKKIFDLEKAFDFIAAQQKEDGSFGEDLYTDWVALALASGNSQEQVIKLVKYFGKSKLENPQLTDYERRAMALMSLGLNPYNTNGENYIEKITAGFDGEQFGDAHEYNDDVFALIVLLNAGYSDEEEIIKKSTSFILGAQSENGSWSESVDMTGAVMESLAKFNQNEQVKNALLKAKDFLKQKQNNDGGWGNASSTAWAIEGILAMNEKPEDWKKGEDMSFDYLATLQDIDGGIKNLQADKEDGNLQNKIWETAYVASALSGKTWGQIMQKFEKPAEGLNLPTKEVSPVKQISKKSAKKISTLAQTATAINAITPSSNLTPKNLEILPRKSWFARLLESIFGF